MENFGYRNEKIENLNTIETIEENLEEDKKRKTALKNLNII